MTLFWIVAAVMVVIALAFVIPALLGRQRQKSPHLSESINLANHREQLLELTNALERGEITQAEVGAARTNIGNTLVMELSLPSGPPTPITQAVDKTPAMVVAALIPMTSIAMYLWLGSAVSLSPQDNNPSLGEDQPSVETMVSGLAEKLRHQPNDPEGWLMLARSYSVMERFSEARDAYARAYALIGDQARLLVDYAEAIAQAENNRLTGKPTELLASALAIEPDNQKGLWLAGFAARQNGDDAQAIDLWRKLAVQLIPGSKERVMVEETIADAGASVESETSTVETPTASAATITVSVTLAPSLASQITGRETLFIFARALDGPPMPLAIQKHTAGELPLVVTLDDSMYMLASFKLSNFPAVSVGARISRTGNATPSPGDLQGWVSPVKTSQAQSVNLVIKDIVE